MTDAQTIETLVKALEGLLLMSHHKGKHVWDEESITDEGFSYGCSVCTRTFDARVQAARDAIKAARP